MKRPAALLKGLVLVSLLALVSACGKSLPQIDPGETLAYRIPLVPGAVTWGPKLPGLAGFA